MNDMRGWYSGLSAQVLDLVADYAGQELFCLDGDSLVLQCLDDPALDFTSGFQLLQAVWNVERFLAKLLATKCRFHIVFFDENRELPACAATQDIHQCKYRLAREVIYQHLKIQVQARFPDLLVRRFTSVAAREFKEYVQTYSVYFVMCHNGVLQGKEELLDETLLMICNMMALGLDVAVMNEIEWRDSKILTRVVRASSSTRPLIDIETKNTRKEIPYLARCKSELQSIAKAKQNGEGLPMTARETLTMVVISALATGEQDQALRQMLAVLLLHLACLTQLSLQQRRLTILEVPNKEIYNTFMDKFCLTATALLQTSEWDNLRINDNTNDLHDLIDGRLLKSCAALSIDDKVTPLISLLGGGWDTVRDCFNHVNENGGPGTFFSPDYQRITSLQISDCSTGEEDDKADFSLLPFEHPIFDKHLASVRVKVLSDNEDECPEPSFEDRTHWHTRRPLGSDRRKLPQKPITKWNNPARWNQKRVSEFTKYAASLTNAKGTSLEPESIFSSECQPQKAKSSIKGELVKQENARNASEANESTYREWLKGRISELRKFDTSRQVKEIRATILGNHDAAKVAFLEPEVRLYLLSLLLLQWQSIKPAQSEDKCLAAAREVWNEIRILRHLINRMTAKEHRMFQKICLKLNIPGLPLPASSLLKVKLCFDFDIEAIKPRQLGEPLDFQAFQLLHCGPMMDRQIGALPDRRVQFVPDEWQRQVLDELDKEHSIFVVAPTSAGKTFISFYAMKKILQEDNDGVLVYVAPTKALVNQIAAEIHARFRKSYPDRSHKTVWAIHTRDIRINDPMKCQILVTVPHLLQIMLLSPFNATTWAPRVKCIIFDEIHSIGHTDEGLVWEQLLLLAPCRIIALSATVGNPAEFADWLESTQSNLDIPMKLIQHSQRYSDLRKYFYTPASNFSFKGLSEAGKKGILESQSIEGLEPLHPITSILSKQRQVPEDLSLEPRDCYMLWKSMSRHSSTEFPVSESLDPKVVFSSLIQRGDVHVWEARLKEALSTWMQYDNSPFEKVRSELETTFATAKETKHTETREISLCEDVRYDAQSMRMKLCTTVFPLLVGLHHQNALPALLFNYERTTCEEIAIATLQRLVKAEEKYKSSAQWKEELARYEEDKKLKQKMARVEASKKKGKGRKQPHAEDEGTANEIDDDNSFFERFDPERPLEQFSFARTRQWAWDDLLKEIERMKRHKVNPLLLEALKRGVGVHHAGLNRRYRQCVERLFRAGFLRVVVATGTLALGINMPCSTVVFCGDSVYLTALNFRQAAGRAGRRGFDILGNVIFHGIPRHKANQLISSRLPDLSGHFPITTSLVLRLCILHHNSKGSAYANRAINSLLSQPRFNFGSAESKEKVLHHLRFSIEYLRRQGLLGSHGEPIRLASSVAHLYHTENSAFSFHALLRAGYFEALHEQYRNNREEKLRTLILVLAHLFGRNSLGQRYGELLERKKELKSPSIVMLPSMPTNAAEALRAHNKSILRTYTSYVATFVDQHLSEPERELPLSKLPVGGMGSHELSQGLGALAANRSRSAFVGLSGHNDQFETIEDLCNTVRSGVFLEESVIPHLDIYPEGGMAPLNAYLYDFFCHGSVEPLEVANRISRSDVWFLLNDFSLILATILVSLETYLDPSRQARPFLDDLSDMNDPLLSDSEDDEEGALDARQGAQHAKPKETATRALSKPGKSPQAAKPSSKNITPENWDDDLDDTEASAKRDSGPELPSNEYKWQAPMVSMEVLSAFKELKEEFDEKFHAIFA
ncbi:putative DEAD/DEAH box helicase [Aspergillus clavatus NRRL 1]|uniref:DEAD/DEAH box helicase, putative n=1 Tax=Aspergillus clavatus (strain ATCC 1007 / CBS 513.65 / DSM 816 / NCTC 3887 / NRRL 1 / QM 1276 / 107) TaxID=344612 RepID=A1CJG1_ASPCL|nr:DEAD/DEAH box helicase, putative [Aspergillus clavatus NRRL 1]EAW09285.1 DEAD/DEAH box helicase, putative [Aspergillus clavatus NRRL 1]